MTKTEALICSAYTGTLFPGITFSELHGAIEEKLGKPIVTHSFASKEVMKKIKQAFKADFLAIEVTDAKGETVDMKLHDRSTRK